jgi:[CysO sulfur-carrier protein]-S-L-cysteine hydrolase
LKVTRSDFKIPQTLVEEMYAHARECAPGECCGLLGGAGDRAATVYRLRNVAPRPEVAYEAAPEELFEAQRRMRARGETLVGVYHSHPRSSDPEPSRTDVRLAFYPEAFYLIIGFDEAGECVLRAFRISEREGRWAPATFSTED